jgi:hydrogenase maturation protease
VSAARILVAGIGNIFLGDDGFGCEVARRLLQRKLPDGVRVVDYGIRGIDLAYALMDGYDASILVDAVRRGNPPGTLFVIEPEAPEFDGALVNAHGLDPASVLKLLKGLGGEVKGLRLVGCEPQQLGSDEDLVMGLSPAVQTAVDPAADLVMSMVSDLLHA